MFHFSQLCCRQLSLPSLRIVVLRGTTVQALLPVRTSRPLLVGFVPNRGRRLELACPGPLSTDKTVFHVRKELLFLHSEESTVKESGQVPIGLVVWDRSRVSAPLDRPLGPGLSEDHGRSFTIILAEFLGTRSCGRHRTHT